MCPVCLTTAALIAGSANENAPVGPVSSAFPTLENPAM